MTGNWVLDIQCIFLKEERHIPENHLSRPYIVTRRKTCTLIDPTSAYFRPLQQENQIEVLDTTFPADRPQVLIWNVESKFEGQVQVEVSYFTSGISWNADYVMITDAAEAKATL
ncbi:MAG: hypothetical protein NT112_00475, partial [Methanoregula sp.]|nr:hypothetical protein [Methanoregula sp.]